MKKLLTLITFLMLSGCSPKDYDDCILKNMKDAKDETAARLIQQSCFDKYYESPPEKKCQTAELTTIEKSKVQIVYKDSWTGSKPSLVFSLYNGNEGLRITELKIKVSADSFPAPQVYHEAYLNVLSGGIGPLSGEDVRVKVADLPKGKWNYEILSLQGCYK